MTTNRLLSENQQQDRDLKKWQEELTRYREDFKSLSRTKDALTKRIRGLEEGKLEAELERDSLKGINIGLQHELENQGRSISTFQKQEETLKHERDIAQKNFIKATGATQKHLGTAKLAEQSKRNLEQEIHSVNNHANTFSIKKKQPRCVN